MSTPTSRIGVRDRAILLLGYAAALRPSEIATLHLADIGVDSHGLLITIRRSKADQEGLGQILGVAAGVNAVAHPIRGLNGGWNAVETDLRLATDGDSELAGLGRTYVSNWLRTGAATTWQPLPEIQRARIAALLDKWDASPDLRRTLAFHAGIRPLPRTDFVNDEPAEVVPIKRKWWRP